MKKIFFLQIILSLFFNISNAQDCNTWLHLLNSYDGVKIGDLDVSGNIITVEANFNPDQNYAMTGIASDLVSKHIGPNDCNYLLRPLMAGITTENGFFYVTSCDYDINKTYHAALVYDGTTLKFYRNGFLMSQIPASGNLVTNDLITTIGENANALISGVTEITKGYINEVRIWNVARTQAQIRTYMNSTLPNPTSQTGLLAYYRFDDLLNKQGNTAYNGILVGAASLNQINPNCLFVADSCGIILNTGLCNFDFSYKQDICNPLSVQFFHIGNTPSTSFWSFGDGNTFSGTTIPTHLYNTTGNYIVKYSITTGTCTDTITKIISVNILNDNLINTTDTTICINTSKQLLTNPVLGFCWSPSTHLSNPNSPNPITTSPVPITYYFTAAVQGANLITNGSFDSGNSGFTSQYNFALPNTTEGEYFVGVNPQAWNPSLSSCTDHTTGNGNMMLVNGAPIADVNVWTQTVNVIPNTNYAFSTWIQALFPPNPAVLSFSINGGSLGNLITARLPTCTWDQFYTTWNSGNNTSATISIVNKNTLVQGNDFALDDISFSPVLIKRDSVKITIDTPRVKTISDTSICPGIPVQLDATGAVSYAWSPSASLNNTTINNPIATPSGNTQYIVSGTNLWGCKANDTVNVNINPSPLITKSRDTSFCSNVPISIGLKSTGGNNFNWSPAVVLDNNTIQNPTATINVTTKFYVTVTNPAGCTGTDSVTIKVNPVPVVRANNDTAVCDRNAIQMNASGAIRYNWLPASGLNNTDTNNPIATPLNTTQYIVTGTNSMGCQGIDTVNISIKANPVVSKSPDTTICSNRTLQLFAGGGTRYSWTPAATLNNTTIDNPIATPSGNTTYRVTVTGSNSCSKTDSVKITIRPLPVFSISPDKSTCKNNSVILSASGGSTYLWSPAAMVSNPYIPNPISNTNTTITFSVKIKDNTCLDSTTLATTVTVLPSPTVQAAKLNDIDCVNSSAQLTASGAGNYVWTPSTGLNNPNIFNPTASIIVQQQYLVTGTDPLTNCTGKDTITVFIKGISDPAFFVPNAFSPNSDGVNDCFRVKHFGTVKSVEMSVFNRMGNRVFYTKNVNDCWDGYFKGSPAEQGNYVYYIKTFNDCGENVKKGNIILLR